MKKIIILVVVLLLVGIGLNYSSDKDALEEDNSLEDIEVATSSDDLESDLEDDLDLNDEDNQFFIKRDQTNDCDNKWNIYFGKNMLQEDITGCKEIKGDPSVALYNNRTVVISFDVNTYSEFSLSQEYILDNRKIEYELLTFNAPGSSYVTIKRDGKTYSINPVYTMESEERNDYCVNDSTETLSVTGLKLSGEGELFSEVNLSELLVLTCLDPDAAYYGQFEQGLGIESATVDGNLLAVTLTLTDWSKGEDNIEKRAEEFTFDLSDLDK